ncbi:MFS transporter [Microbacterium sp. A588]
MSTRRAPLPRVFLAAAVSNFSRQMGFWVSVTFFQWHVAELSGGDAGASSTLYFLQLLPMFLLPPTLGALIDRWSRWWLMVAPGGAMTVVAIAAATATTGMSDQPEVWQIQLLALLLGIATAISSPAFQAVIPGLVSVAELPRALAAGAALMNGSRLVGPGVAGLALALGGNLATCLWMLAGFESIGFLLMLRVSRDARRASSNGKYLADIIDGFRETTRRPALGQALQLVAATSLFGLAYLSVLPAVTVQVLDAGDFTYAVLLASAALGALAAAFVKPLQPRTLKSVSGSLALMAAAVFIVMASPVIALTATACFVVSAVGAGIMIGLNIQIQQAVSEQYRGRVVSLFLWAWGGILPFGGLMFGALVLNTGFAGTGALMAALLLTVAVLNWHRQARRHDDI